MNRHPREAAPLFLNFIKTSGDREIFRGSTHFPEPLPPSRPSLTQPHLFDILWRATCSSIRSSTFCSSRPRVSSTSSEMSFRMPLRTRNVDSAQGNEMVSVAGTLADLLVLRERLLRRVPQLQFVLGYHAAQTLPVGLVFRGVADLHLL